MKKSWKMASEYALQLIKFYGFNMARTSSGEEYVLSTTGEKDKVSSPFKTGEGFCKSIEELLGHSLPDELTRVEKYYAYLCSDEAPDDKYFTVYDEQDWCEMAESYLTDLIKCRPANVRVEYVYKRMKRMQDDWEMD